MSQYSYDFRTGKLRKKSAGRHYTMGGTSDWMGWDVSDVSANLAVHENAEKVLARGRDLERNDPYVAQHLRLLVSNVIGASGFKFSCSLKSNNGRASKTFNQELARQWRLAGKLKNSPTEDGRMSRVDVGNHWVRRLAVDGEVICVRVQGSDVNRFRYSKKFIDPSLLDWRLNGRVRNSDNVIKMGVEVDQNNRPVAYHFLNRHRNAAYFEHVGYRPEDYERIPVDLVEHSFLMERSGQVRGISPMAPVGVRSRMLDKFEEAVVVGCRVAASKMAFYRPGENFDVNSIPGMEEDGELKQEVEPATLELLPPGIDGVEPFDPGYPPANLEQFHRVMGRGIASGLGADYCLMSNNLADVNYSSLRQMVLTMRSLWRGMQRFYIEHHEEPDFLAWLEVQRINPDGPEFDSAKLDKLLRDECYKFQGRGWQWVDPQKEVNAQATALEHNLTSEARIIAETHGVDFEDILEEREEFQREVERRNLNTTTENE